MTDVRCLVDEVTHLEPGEHKRNVDVAHAARALLGEQCCCVVLVSFTRNANGLLDSEVAVTGSGPLGFGPVVRSVLRTAADVVGEEVYRAEVREQRRRGQS